MTQYCLYKNPDDSPDKYVVRRWTIVGGKCLADVEPLIVADTIEEACDKVPTGLHWIDRMPADEPCIVGTWI